MKRSQLVSIIIPCKNSASLLEKTLRSLRSQQYAPIEILIIDSNSTDNTAYIAKKYACTVYQYNKRLQPGTFDAPFKRNYGVKKAKGTYVYCVDADMEVSPSVISEAVHLCKQGAKAVIVPEDSIGEGIWIGAKNLERRCYWGDELIESPRFFLRSAWLEVGGVDESLVSGRDDGDLYQRILEKQYKVGRTQHIVLHNEGELTMKKLFLKKVLYGRDVLTYIKKRPLIGVLSYNPIRPSYIRNWRLFLTRPSDAVLFFFMKSIENVGAIVGIGLSLLRT